MPSYSAPGVYVEEVPSAIKPIAGVGTSTAGFVGLADGVDMPMKPGFSNPRQPTAEEKKADGTLKDGVDLTVTPANTPKAYYALAPKGVPQLVTSWESFRNTFGDIGPGNLVLAHAVYGFFHNGGTRCWIARFAPTGSANNKTLSVADAKAGLNALKAIDEIALVAVPGITNVEVQKAVLEHCSDPFLQDRFAILDGQPPADPPATPTATAVKGNIGNNPYGAIYFPWIDVGVKRDDGTPVHVPPSGHIAGVYARVDGARGVHKAPANEVIAGALGVQVRVTREDQAGLNPDGVNVIRDFGGNITVWGARTLADLGKDAEWKYVNVRRLFNYLRESIDQGTQWVVFEPNSPELWSKIRRNVGAFLTTVWSSGALFGNTPEEAFYVRCDETLNTVDVREQGLVVTEIGVAVVKPAEFVVFRISQWAGAGQ